MDNSKAVVLILLKAFEFTGANIADVISIITVSQQPGSMLKVLHIGDLSLKLIVGRSRKEKMPNRRLGKLDATKS